MTYVGVVDGTLTSELRRAVLRPSWPVGIVMHGDSDPEAVHMAVVEHGAAVSACFLVPRLCVSRAATAPWQLRGMATAAGSRGQGLGGEVLAAVVAELVRRGADLLWCESREVAIGFYEQHGFVADGPRYVHAEIGTVHQLMWRELSGPASQPGG